MDPITHGIAGSLLGKGYFAEKHGPATIVAATLGAIFPDIDVFRSAFSDDPLATIRYHRGFTHSFIGLPLFAFILALIMWAAVRWWQKRKGKSWAPFWILFAAFAVGIASHILLDATTSYGTCMFAFASYHRYAWDWMFIIDFTLTALLLLPQMAAWEFRNPQRAVGRGVAMWVIFSAAAYGVYGLAGAMGYGFPSRALGVIVVLLALLFLAPLARGFGFRFSRGQWCRAGLYAALAYVLTCATAHHLALQRVRDFASANGITVVNEAAIPLPPSLMNWDGMIRTTNGVYRWRFSLSDKQAPAFSFLADSPPGPVMSQALALPEVQTYLWFSRFPVIRTTEENGDSVVEFLDVRFTMRRRSETPPPFTFRVVMDPQGRLMEEEWAMAASRIHLHRGHNRKVFEEPSSPRP